MITGKLIKIGDIQQISDTFKKREVVVKTGGEYPQTIPVDFMQDKVDLVRGISVGDEVSISYDLRGREYNGKYFVNVVGWKIESLEGRQDLTRSEKDYSQDLKDAESQDVPF